MADLTKTTQVAAIADAQSHPKHHKTPEHQGTPTPILHLIRHGEKPHKDSMNGLSPQGIARAQALVEVFGPDSKYNIKCIIAQHPKKNGDENRPYQTILPLSKLLAIPPDTSIDRDDVTAAAAAAKSFSGPGNVLLCWEHDALGEIAKILVNGADAVNQDSSDFQYPKSRFDLIWKIWYEDGKWRFAEAGSEGVPGLDDEFMNEASRAAVAQSMGGE